MRERSRATRLARRYPVLASVPPEERARMVRLALRHPLILLLVVGLGLLALPPYLRFMFDLLGVESDPNLLLMLAKIALTILIPIAVAVPLLTRFVMPRFILKAMASRGYSVTPGPERASAVDAAPEKQRPSPPTDDPAP